LTQWVHRHLPRAFAPRIAKALHEAAWGPTMDYRDNPQHRVLHHTKWCIVTPASDALLLRRWQCAPTWSEIDSTNMQF